MSDNGIPQNRLSAKQQRAIGALMTARDAREAAKLARVSERSLYRWLGDPLFQSEMQRAGQELIISAVRRLASLTWLALDTLEAEMKNKRAAPSVRVRSADVVLSKLLQLKELAELDERIKRLEEGMGGKR